ncbi:Uncharacterized protein, contains HEPN domain, UPF0332 family [Agromyces sp. CF514]|nr:Uncharacterized protein, contains HEPN domain, UPF0332 family [Agromyces sp. CF514]
MSTILAQITSDRLVLAGVHLSAADNLLAGLQFRSSISRSYYAMYHAARAIAYASHGGDDYEKHSVLPRNLPGGLDQLALRESQLTDARLLRNQADYDPYPALAPDWEPDARSLYVTASEFVNACEDFSLDNGLV